MSQGVDCPFCARHCNMRFLVTGEVSPYCIGDNEVILFYRCPTCKRQHAYSIARFGDPVPECLRCCVSCQQSREESGGEATHTVFLKWVHDPQIKQLATKWDGH